MDDKIIVSNRSALTAKYGTAGMAKVGKAIAALIAADGKRGITSRIVYLDDAAAMKRFAAPAVTERKSARQNKAAIDAIFKTADPDYLMILGATDVVPHQDLANPVFGDDDPDEQAFSDLPYACSAAYSRDVARFKGPTRVVGRLPDLTGAREPSHLLALLATATAYRKRPVADYGSCFGLSTASWRKSTEMSLFNLFGNSKALQVSPPKGPRHAARLLAPLMHFINCHGGDADPQFYGEEDKQKDPEQPPSLTSRTVAGKIQPATVAAVECCYGAQLYDSVTLALPLPICQQYLAQGAYGYFGSTTIAYGPAEDNGTADLITQFFLLAVMAGASLGRAALVARQRYVRQASELDPIDLKTLAQFNLLGDPSIHPAQVGSPQGVPRGMSATEVQRQQRHERRGKLRAEGQFLEASKPTASQPARRDARSATVIAALANIAREAGLTKGQDFLAYDVAVPAAAARAAAGTVRGGKAAKAPGQASRYYVAVCKRAQRKPRSVGQRVAAVAKEVGGRIVGYRIYLEK